MSDTETQEAYVRAGDWDWLLVCDAGRYDHFTELAEGILPGGTTAERLHNGGVGYTADWMAQMFPDEYGGLFVHGGKPVWSLHGVEWDERDHFGAVPEYAEFDWNEEYGTSRPGDVNAVVREHLAEHDGGVVRYLQPHTPYREMPELTRGNSLIQRVARAVRAGDRSLADVESAYRDNFEWVLREGVVDLLPDLDGTVVVTADHGECLGDCGQWFHGRGHDPHDHLVTVPWAVVQ